MIYLYETPLSAFIQLGGKAWWPLASCLMLGLILGCCRIWGRNLGSETFNTVVHIYIPLLAQLTSVDLEVFNFAMFILKAERR